MMTRRNFITTTITAICIPNVLTAKTTTFADVKQDYYEQVSNILKQKVYEENTAEMRRDIETTLLDHFYEFMKKHGISIYENTVICDETNNTAKTIDNNELHVMIGIKERYNAEYSIVNFCVMSTSSEFNYI